MQKSSQGKTLNLWKGYKDLVNFNFKEKQDFKVNKTYIEFRFLSYFLLESFRYTMDDSKKKRHINLKICKILNDIQDLESVIFHEFAEIDKLILYDDKKKIKEISDKTVKEIKKLLFKIDYGEKK